MKNINEGYNKPRILKGIDVLMLLMFGLSLRKKGLSEMLI